MAVKKVVPIGKAQSREYPRWMNKAAKAARNRKSKMWIKYRNSRECKDLVEYKKLKTKQLKSIARLNEILKERDSGRMLSNVDITKEDNKNKQLKNLKVNKAPGVYEIVPRILIENADYLSQPLEDVYRESLETGVVPNEWKRANVTPIYIKGPRELSFSYRPVSLTSYIHICQVLESIIRESMVDYSHKYNSIRDTQHRFVKRRSYLTH
jgi:transposase-like protein